MEKCYYLLIQLGEFWSLFKFWNRSVEAMLLALLFIGFLPMKKKKVVLFYILAVTIDLHNYLQCWAEENLNYPIYFLTYVASSTIDYVKSFLEWMSDSIAKSFEKTRDNAFLLKQVVLFIYFLFFHKISLN